MPTLIGILDVLEGRVIQVFSRFGDRKWGNEREVNLILVLTWAGGKWSEFEEKMHSRTPILICSSVWRTLSGVWSLSEKKPLSVIRYTLELRTHWFNEFMNPLKDFYNPQNLRGSYRLSIQQKVPDSSSNTTSSLF